MQSFENAPAATPRVTATCFFIFVIQLSLLFLVFIDLRFIILLVTHYCFSLLVLLFYRVFVSRIDIHRLRDLKGWVVYFL